MNAGNDMLEIKSNEKWQQQQQIRRIVKYTTLSTIFLAI